MQVKGAPTTNHRTAAPPRPSRVPCQHVSPVVGAVLALASIIEPSSPTVPRSQTPSPTHPQSRNPELAQAPSVRRNGGEQAQGGQAPGADERPPRHRRRQGDRREGRIRLPAQHLPQEAGRRRGDLCRGPQEGRRLQREVRGEARRYLHLHGRRLPRHRQRQAEPTDGVYKGQAEDQGEHQRRAEVHARHLPQALQVVEG